MLGRARYRAGGRVPTGGGGRLHRRWLFAVPVLVLALSGAGATGALAAGPPTVETERASEVTRSSAVLNATVGPQGSATECNFEYGTSPGVLDEDAPCAYSPGSRPILVPELARLQGLAPSTVYYFRIHAKNEDGGSFGEELEFTTLPKAPKTNTGNAKEIHGTSATLAGLVTPNGSLVTECYFQYGPTREELNQSVPCAQEVGEGSEPSEAVLVTAHITGLEESTRYVFRVVARNAFGLEHGGKEGFRTLPSEPSATTGLAGLIGRTSAKLKGSVTPNDALVESCYFEYGEAAGGGLAENTIPCETLPGAGETPEPAIAQLTGLSESTRYVFRLVATNSFGTGEGGVGHFMTQPSAPTVRLHQAAEITMHSAELSASVNPEGSLVTECYFEYGTTPAFGGVAPCSTLPGEGEKFVKVSAVLSGLSPDTRYITRAVAVNAFGAGARSSEKKAFTTASEGEPPVVTKVKPSKGRAAGGTSVAIKGARFEGVTGVFFGEAEATIEHVSPSQIEVVSPPGVGTVDVTVATEAEGTSTIRSVDRFTYGAPEITGLSPDSGPASGGTEVTVSGYGFELGAQGTSFAFGKAAASSVECTSDTSCIVIAPRSSSGKAMRVSVQATVNGKRSSKVAYTYTA